MSQHKTSNAYWNFVFSKMECNWKFRDCTTPADKDCGSYDDLMDKYPLLSQFPFPEACFRYSGGEEPESRVLSSSRYSSLWCRFECTDKCVWSKHEEFFKKLKKQEKSCKLYDMY